MKTRTWILIFAAILLVCSLLSVWLLHGKPTQTARIYQDGKLIQTVDLSHDQIFTVTYGEQENTVTVKDGKIAVTYATCPDQYCVKKGWQNSGAPIVCLPNRLVIFFSDSPTDAIVG